MLAIQILRIAHPFSKLPGSCWEAGHGGEEENGRGVRLSVQVQTPLPHSTPPRAPPGPGTLTPSPSVACDPCWRPERRSF